MIDPHAAAVLRDMQASATQMPSDTATWLRGYRASLASLVRLQGPPPPIHVTTTTCPGPAGPVSLRVFRPEAEGDLATLLFCHGGGFVAGTLDAYDSPLRHLALRSGWQIVAPDYRLAPEHPFPAAPDDCAACLLSLAGGPLRADPQRLAVGGDSAGGLLATVLARRAHEAGLPLRHQVLLYPNTDLRPGPLHPSRLEFDGTVVRLDELYRSLDLYLPDQDRSSADISPLLAPRLEGLCPTLLVTCEHDPLRDEAEAYGRRLAEAGVPLHAERLPGMIHGVLQYAAAVPAGDALITRIAEVLRG